MVSDTAYVTSEFVKPALCQVCNIFLAAPAVLGTLRTSPAGGCWSRS